MFTLSHRSRQRSLIQQLKDRLILTVGLLVVCLVLTSGIGIFVLITQQQLGDRKVTMTTQINDLSQAMVDQETAIHGYVTTQSTTFLDPFSSGQTDYQSLLQQLKSETTGSNFQSSASALAGVDKQASIWSTNYAQAEITRIRAGNVAAAQSNPVNARGKALVDAFKQAIDRLQQANDADLAALQIEVNRINFGALAGAGLLSMLAIFWLWHTFTRFVAMQRDQLTILKKTAVALGAGDLSIRVQNITDADLHDVGQTFNTMASRLQEQHNALRERDILGQVSYLNTILTGSLDLTTLMDDFLQSCLSKLDVQIGSLYVYDPQQNHLRLLSTRGVAGEQIPQTFALGEGFVGRTAQELLPLMITAPQEETQPFQIKTILGNALPASMYHLPLVRGKQLLGVLAIGSMYPMREQTRYVLSVVASNVAAALSNAQAYVQIQQQATELRERTRQQEQANLSLRQQRDELTTLNAALVEANQARSRFLSTMSHELRTPLTSTIGFAQLLLRPSSKALLSERHADYIERILKNAEHLLSLINDVLDLAKVEAGRMDVDAKTVNLKELLTSLVEETHSIAIERSLTVSVEVSEEVAILETDPQKLRQIVLNLLSNALKFTQQGTITITATSRTFARADEWKTTDAHQVAIAVKDSGIGIAPDQQAHIFEAFYQVDSSNSRKYAGTGLGLSIVREFTTLLGGKVEIESQPDQGTTFTVLLPLQTRDQQSLPEIQLSPLSATGSIAGQREDTNDASLLVTATDDNPDVLLLIPMSPPSLHD
jgi:two-component system chemotaxis sensor kinase CheA